MGILLWLKRLRHGRGFGIHSPYAYTMVQEVLRNRRGYAYYGYDTIAEIYARGDFKPSLPFGKALLAFRVLNKFKPLSIEIMASGETAGLLTEIARLACPNTRIVPGRGNQEAEMVVADVEHGLPPEKLPAFALVFGASPCTAATPPKGHIYYNGHTLVKAGHACLPPQKFEVRF